MRSGKVVIGVVAGAAVGAILGILFSPAKGSVIRKRIARRGADYADDAKEKFNEYIDVINDEYEAVKEEALDLVEMAKEKAVSLVGAKHTR
jgi:gas vesicle protein